MGRRCNKNTAIERKAENGRIFMYGNQVHIAFKKYGERSGFYRRRMIFLKSGLCIAALAWLVCSGPDRLEAGAAGDLAAMNIQEREAAQQARKTGFGDLEIDNLHGSISARLSRMIALQDIPLSKGTNRWVMKGVDGNNETFYRFRLREGMSFSMEAQPVRYIFKAHCYVYPSGDGKNLKRIIFQFYRINFSGASYSRELRRVIHPDPRNQANLQGPPQTGRKIDLLNNEKILLEQYEEPSESKPVWEGPDGVPFPRILGMKPRRRIELNPAKDPPPYDKQVRIILRYKKLLRNIDSQLYELVRSRELDRRIRIEKILDFPA